jgi:hypothetical protein
MSGVSIDVSAPSQADVGVRPAYVGGGSFITRFQQLSDAKAAADSALPRLGQAASAAHAAARARQHDEAAQVRAEADDYAAKVRAEADNYAAKIRAEADGYATRARTAADALVGKAAAAEAAAMVKQQEAETALAACREATARAVRAKADGDARAATFNRRIAELQAYVDEALGKR